MSSSAHASSDLAATLLERARGGSSSSLGRLMSMYANYLKMVVAAQIDGKLNRRVSASDVVQETFYEAHRDFAAFRGQTPQEFLGWMRRILVNNLLRAVEQHVSTAKRDVRREVSLDQMREDVEHSAWRLAAMLPANQVTPSVDAVQREDESHLAATLAALPADYRDVLRLRHMEGLPFAQVANRMNRSEGAARMLWLRALKQLRVEMNVESVESVQGVGGVGGVGGVEGVE